MSPADTFVFLLDSHKVILRKDQISPERWGLDFGTIPQPFSMALTEVRLYLDPAAKVRDCEAFLGNYAFELFWNGKELMRGPAHALNVGTGINPPVPSEPAIVTTLNPGDHLTGAVFLGTAFDSDNDIPRPGEPFIAAEDFVFFMSLQGIATDTRTTHPNEQTASIQPQKESKYRPGAPE
jgi:hypothetical protein